MPAEETPPQAGTPISAIRQQTAQALPDRLSWSGPRVAVVVPRPVCPVREVPLPQALDRSRHQAVLAVLVAAQPTMAVVAPAGRTVTEIQERLTPEDRVMPAWVVQAASQAHLELAPGLNGIPRMGLVVGLVVAALLRTVRRAVCTAVVAAELLIPGGQTRRFPVDRARKASSLSPMLRCRRRHRPRLQRAYF